MKISTKARYGLRAVAELVEHYGHGTLSLKDIAEQQQLPRNYLENLFNSIKLAGLVRSKRGPKGGWELTRPPDQITLSQVLEALEGDLGVVDCVDHPDTCERVEGCPTREIFVEISAAIRAVLDRYSLEDLHQRKVELEALMPAHSFGKEPCLAPGR